MLSLINIDLSDFKYTYLELSKMSNSIGRINKEAEKYIEILHSDIKVELTPSRNSPHHYYNRGLKVSHIELMHNIKKQRLYIIKNTKGCTQNTMLDIFKNYALQQLIEHKKEN